MVARISVIFIKKRVMECRSDGVSEYWSIGVMEYSGKGSEKRGAVPERAFVPEGLSDGSLAV